MDRLWAPWRLSYVTAAQVPATDCIFCDAGASRDIDLVVLRRRHAYVILNLYPYNNGHLMVVPRAHVADPIDLDDADHGAVCELVRRTTAALRQAVRPDGFNVGLNLGRAAGAGIDAHCHWHVVPRWNGDTNFMTTVGEMRVLPENLGASAARLRPIFARLDQPEA